MTALLFGPFRLDPATGELTRDGMAVPVQLQPARLLVLLVDRAGEIVTRDEIRQHLWNGETTVAFEDGINYAVRQIRIALGDDAVAPRFIQTVPRVGYRFIAAVTGPSTSVASAAANPALIRRVPLRTSSIAALIFVAGLALGIQAPRRPISATVQHWRAVVDAHLSGRAVNCPVFAFFDALKS